MLRRLLVPMLLLAGIRLQAQTTQTNVLTVNADTVKITNSKDSGELVIHNHSRGVQGVLYNMGNGVTQFVPVKSIQVGDSTLIIIGTDTTTIFSAGSNIQPVYQGDPNVCLYAAQIDSVNMRLHWWKTDNDFYQNAKIGVIGDSQGAGVFASSYPVSIMGRLQTFIYAVATNDLFTNYCVPGYNSRNLAPTGSNPYVDNQHNVTKALADGNKIILLCNTSNDFYANASGGVTSLAEDMANTMLIADACRAAGATLFAVSTFPRTAFDTLERDTLGIMANYLNQKFGPRCAYVYHLVEDSLHPNQLNPSLQVGDNIHLNDAGCAIVANALRDMFTSYYTSNNTVASYELQRANTFNSTFGDYQIIRQPNNPTITLPADSAFYRVRVVYSNGYLSNWSNVIQGTTAHKDSIFNQPPVVSSGAPKILWVPTSTTTLQVNASDANVNGSIAGYQWFVAQGNPVTFASPNSATTTVSGLVEGTYIFRCQVTDNLGLVAYADQVVTVEVPDSNTAAAKFNFNMSAQNVSGWVDVTGGPLAAGNNGMIWTDNVHNVNLVEISNSTNVWGANFGSNANNTNGQAVADAGGFPIPPAVIGSGWYTNNIAYAGSASDQMKVTGLSPSKVYKLKFYCSLNSTFNLTANPTIVVVNDNTLNAKQVSAVGNTSNAIIFRGIVPNTSGEIYFSVGSEPGVSQFGMLNGLEVQVDSLSGSAIAPHVVPEKNDTIQLPNNSVRVSVTVSDVDAPLTSLTWVQVSGPSSAVISSPNTMATSVSNLVAGTYVFSCTATDGYGATGTANVTVVVNPASADPMAYVSMSQWSFTSPGWGVLVGVPSTSVVTLSTALQSTTLGSTPITVSTVNTANWVPFATTATSDSTGETNDDGGGFLAPVRVQEGCFFNMNTYNDSIPQFQITGLPAGTYTVTMFGSLKTSVVNAIGANVTTEFRVNGGSPVVINTAANTSHAAVFTGITVGSNGTMNLFFNPTAGQGTNIGMMSFFILDKTN